MKPLSVALVLVWLLGLAVPAGYSYAPPLGPLTLTSSLAGQMLVANRQLTDSNFARTVIFLIEHTEQGALGVIVNRRAASASMAQILGSLGISSHSARRMDVFYGGPVELNRGFVLHSPDHSFSSTRKLSRDIALSMGADVLKAIADGKGPARTRFVLGYAGWEAGQLEREIARIDWLIAPADPEVIFAANTATIWELALKHAGMRL